MPALHMGLLCASMSLLSEGRGPAQGLSGWPNAQLLKMERYAGEQFTSHIYSLEGKDTPSMQGLHLRAV